MVEDMVQILVARVRVHKIKMNLKFLFDDLNLAHDFPDIF